MSQPKYIVVEYLVLLVLSLAADEVFTPQVALRKKP